MMIAAVAAKYHMLGYDITYVPGPPGQTGMFNFRTIMAREFDRNLFLETARALPLPAWKPPPH